MCRCSTGSAPPSGRAPLYLQFSVIPAKNSPRVGVTFVAPSVLYCAISSNSAIKLIDKRYGKSLATFWTRSSNVTMLMSFTAVCERWTPRSTAFVTLEGQKCVTRIDIVTTRTTDETATAAVAAIKVAKRSVTKHRHWCGLATTLPGHAVDDDGGSPRASAFPD